MYRVHAMKEMENYSLGCTAPSTRLSTSCKRLWISAASCGPRTARWRDCNILLRPATMPAAPALRGVLVPLVLEDAFASAAVVSLLPTGDSDDPSKAPLSLDTSRSRDGFPA